MLNRDTARRLSAPWISIQMKRAVPGSPGTARFFYKGMFIGAANSNMIMADLFIQRIP